MLFIGNWNVRHHQPTFNLAPSRPKSWIFLCATGVVEVGDTGDRISFTLTVAWRLYPQIASQPMATPDIKFRRVPWIPCVSALDIVDEFPIEDWISLLRASIFCDGVEIEVVVTCHHNPKVQWDDLHASRNRRRESKGQWQGLQLQNLFGAVDEWWWQVTCDETRLLDQGQRSTQGWLLKICAQHFSGAPASFWDGAW